MSDHPDDGEVRIISARRIISFADTDPEALACRGERVVALGPVAELRARFPGAEVRDLGDVTVVPGFNDAHQHPTICAEQSLHVDLSPERVYSRGDVTDALRQRAARTPDGEWVVAAGLDPARTLGGADLTRDDLDKACPGHPVLAVHVTLHSGVLNSQGLRLAGLSDDSADPPGGELGRDAAGHLTGFLSDQALYDVAFPAFTRRQTTVPPPGPAAMERAFLEFAERLLAAGITSAGDAMVGPGGWELLCRLDQRGALPLRVNALVAHEHFGHFRPTGCAAPPPESRLRIGGVKVFADGAVNGGACWVTEPVIGATGHGLPRMPAGELAKVVREIHDAGWRVAVHANGDRAIGVTLDAIAQAQRGSPRSDARHRIEHVAIINAEIVAAMRELGTVAVPFGQYPAAHGDKLRAYYEPERTERMFAHRTLLDAGIPVAGSSDYPCGPFEPLYAMRSCVTRADRDGRAFGGSQRISARQALALYTSGAAFASGEERWKGRLAPGYLADFVVLGEDPRAVSGDKLTQVPVLQTWVGGRPAWSAPGYSSLTAPGPDRRSGNSSPSICDIHH
ncbi:MAG TPA: amidohydrolase [Trebonia sp.]